MTNERWALLQDGGVGEVLGDAGLPLGGAGGVVAGAERVDGDEVDGLELADGFGSALGLADRSEQTGLGEELACELVQAGGGGETGQVGQCCVLGRAVKLGSHSPHRCVNARRLSVPILFASDQHLGPCSEFDLNSGGDIYGHASDTILSDGSAKCKRRIEKGQIYSIAN